MSAQNHNASEKKKDYLQRTLHIRVRDKHAKWLLERARAVNFVWNYDNELSSKVLEREGRFLSDYDLHEYTRGATKAGLELHSQTVQAVNEEYARRRKQARKARLRWRVSDHRRANYSLGWVPRAVGDRALLEGHLAAGRSRLAEGILAL